MEALTISPLGQLPVTRPKSWTALADLTLSWPTDARAVDFRPRLLRCSAAALGMAVLFDPLPTYRPASLDVLTYGEAVLEVLLPRGVALAEILRAGREVADFLSGSLPVEQEVAETADFTGSAA